MAADEAQAAPRAASQPASDQGHRPSGSAPTPLVSIGLPVYNGELYLERAIESVLTQTIDDWELIITDNGSEDGTEEIARSFAQRDPRISYHRNQTNLGATANFEIAYRLAGGEFFCWLAHDDWYDPTYLSRCIEVLQGNPGAVMCFTGMAVVDRSGEVFRTKTEPLDRAPSTSAIRRFHSVLWHLEDPTAPVFGVMRRDLLGQTGLIRNSNEPDRILIAELSLLGSIHQIPEKLFFHFGPAGHTVRDNWAWLNPRNRGKPRLATLRITYYQLRAILKSPLGIPSKVLLTADLAVAILITRVRGKVKSIRSNRRRRRQQQQQQQQQPT